MTSTNTLLSFFLAVASIVGVARSQDECFDQVNTGATAGGWVIPGLSPVGQEFRPTDHSLDTVDLLMNSQSSSTGQARVRIRRSTITGPVLGTSTLFALSPPASPLTLARFRFLQPVALVPGDRYVLEVEHVVGSRLGVFLTPGSPYSRGRAIQSGIPQSGSDLWFRTGRLRVVSVADQANVGSSGGGFVIPGGAPVGQQFVPTRSSVECVELRINSQTPGEARALVRIRRGGIAGPIVGVSAVSTAIGTDVRTEAFNFPAAVSVAPGVLHVIEVVHSGGDRLGVFGSLGNPYAPGAAIFRGVAQPGTDLWFRAGVQQICRVCQRSIGFQGPGAVTATMCGQGLALGDVSDYLLTGAPAGAPGLLILSLAGSPDLPIFGGILAAGTVQVVSAPIVADAAGAFSARFMGVAGVLDIVAQSVVVDLSQPMNFAFSNALLLELGR